MPVNPFNSYGYELRSSILVFIVCFSYLGTHSIIKPPAGCDPYTDQQNSVKVDDWKINRPHNLLDQGQIHVRHIPCDLNYGARNM